MAKLDRKRKGCISRYCPLTSLTSFTSLTSKNSSFNFQNPFLHFPKKSFLTSKNHLHNVLKNFQNKTNYENICGRNELYPAQ